MAYTLALCRSRHARAAGRLPYTLGLLYSRNSGPPGGLIRPPLLPYAYLGIRFRYKRADQSRPRVLSICERCRRK